MLPVCKDIADAITLLRTAPIENLRSAAWLEYEALPALGLNVEGRFPRHLKAYQGRGAQSWQWPNQFAKYLAFLSEREVSSYLELGLFNGGTFIITIEYLSRFASDFQALGVDVEVRPPVRTYLESAHSNVQVLNARTDDPIVCRAVAQRLWDLALIDAGHAEQECWADYQMVRDYTRLAAFHDISNDFFTGVAQVWERIASCMPRRWIAEFTEQYPELLMASGKRDYGLGIVRLRD